MIATSLPQRFWDKVYADPSGCWLWTAYLKDEGYGQFGTVGQRYAHRLLYIDWFGPTDLTIDHLCRVRACVNPRHLEAVTLHENILRGTGTSAVNAKKTHCVRGHEFTSTNTYLNATSGARQCRTCRKGYLEKERNEHVS